MGEGSLLIVSQQRVPHTSLSLFTTATALVFMQDALHEIRPRRSTPIGRYDKPWSLSSHWLYDCRSRSIVTLVATPRPVVRGTVVPLITKHTDHSRTSATRWHSVDKGNGSSRFVPSRALACHCPFALRAHSWTLQNTILISFTLFIPFHCPGRATPVPPTFAVL